MINEREGENKFKEKSLDRSLNGSFSPWEKARMRAHSNWRPSPQSSPSGRGSRKISD
jgi:hypothetical protein